MFCRLVRVLLCLIGECSCLISMVVVLFRLFFFSSIL